MKNGFNFYDKAVKISRNLSDSECKNLELFIMAKFVYDNKDEILKNLPSLKSFNSDIETIYKKVVTFLENPNNTDIFPIQSELLILLNLYNWAIRLRADVTKLAKLHEKYPTNILPCQMPSEFVDGKNLWVLGNPGTKPENWLGHGYYWQIGDGKKDTAGPQDYDCFESGFVKIKNAKVLLADYDLLKHDFPFLKDKSYEYINKWLIDECAYLSEGQTKRLISENDIGKFLDIKSIDDILDFSQKRFGMRQRGFGRAATFFAAPEFSIQDGKFNAHMISVKGNGTQKNATDFTVKENGLLSMVDAFKEFCMQKLIQRIAEINNTPWRTVQTYAIIDIGIKIKDGLENPGTGYIGERFGLTIRQAHSRFVSAYDEPCFFSVVTDESQKHPFAMSFKKTLLSYGLTSEQEPVGEILHHDILSQIEKNETDWNIQSDATMCRMVDFSQYYALPNSPLNPVWKVSKKAILKGIKAGRALRHFIKNPEICKEWFGTSDEAEINKIMSKSKEELAKEFGKFVGDTKPKFSWSWFLETDDSEISKWSFEMGYKYNGKAESLELISKINEWLPKKA